MESAASQVSAALESFDEAQSSQLQVLRWEGFGMLNRDGAGALHVSLL